jgi:hypothetical protein
VTAPEQYRVVAGNRIPLELVPRIIAAIRARYPAATSGIVDHDAAVRAALRAWITETWTAYEEAQAKAPLPITIAQTVAAFDAKAEAAAEKAATDAERIVDDATAPAP